MQPKEHIIYGFFYTLILYIFVEQITLFSATIIWLSSWFFIDLDHPIRYVYKTRRLGPIGFWRWSKKVTKAWKRVPQSEKDQYKIPVFMFHGIEMMIVLILLSSVHIVFLYIFLGFLFHHMLDYIDLYKKRDNLFMKVSIIYVLWFNRTRVPFEVPY